MQVRTHHRIIAHGHDRMVLADCASDRAIVVADREGCCGAYTWTLKAEGADDVKVNARDHAIDAMIDVALLVSPGDGYSTFVPHGVRELP